VDRDEAAASFLGRIIVKFDDRADIAPWIQHHVPGEIGDLAGAQAGSGASDGGLSEKYLRKTSLFSTAVLQKAPVE